jgi:hypothetical protein
MKGILLRKNRPKKQQKKPNPPPRPKRRKLLNTFTVFDYGLEQGVPPRVRFVRPGFSNRAGLQQKA